MHEPDVFNYIDIIDSRIERHWDANAVVMQTVHNLLCSLQHEMLTI